MPSIGASPAGIDRRHDHGVGIVEAGAELVEQVAQARIAVRLDDGDDPALGDRARGLEHGGDLDRVVAVIVDDLDAVPRPVRVKRRLTPPKLGQAGSDGGVRDAEMMGDGKRAGGVLDVVLARHGDRQVLDDAALAVLAVADDGGEDRAAALDAQVRVAHVGLRAGAIGDDAPVLDAPDQRLHLRDGRCT